MIGVWLVGAPGVGKSTAARNVVRMGRTVSTFVDNRWTLVQYTKPSLSVMFSGLYRGRAFDGGDTMSVQDARRALDFVRSLPTQWHPDALVLEGARFCYKSVFNEVKKAFPPHVIFLDGSPKTLTERRRKRKKDWALRGGVDTAFQKSMLKQAEDVANVPDPDMRAFIDTDHKTEEHIAVRVFEEICGWLPASYFLV